MWSRLWQREVATGARSVVLVVEELVALLQNLKGFAENRDAGLIFRSRGFLLQFLDGVDLLLDSEQAFRGSKGEHPSDQSAVHSGAGGLRWW